MIIFLLNVYLKIFVRSAVSRSSPPTVSRRISAAFIHGSLPGHNDPKAILPQNTEKIKVYGGCSRRLRAAPRSVPLRSPASMICGGSP
jgi:hypothetical protein